MKDYHQRFRERFKNTNPALWNWMPSAVKVDDILAFIDEIVAEELKKYSAHWNYENGIREGARVERAILIEKVEGEYERWSKLAETGGYSEKGHASAYRDLLTWLRREEKDGPCEHSFVWCDECSTEPPQSGTQEETCPDQDGCAENPRNLPPLQTGAAFVGGFPEELLAGNSPQEETEPTIEVSNRGTIEDRPRVSMTKDPITGVRTVTFEDEATVEIPRQKETEKEGASFSGRGEAEKVNKYGQKWCILPTCDKLAGHDGYYCEDHHSKYYFGNTATPQSREQSTGWKHHPECIGHVGNTPGCYVTPEVLEAAQKETNHQ